jgi:hypothetical protein
MDELIPQIVALRSLTVRELRERYLEEFGEETKSRNRQFLIKRIAFRLQERRHGCLSARALARAEELARDAPIRRRYPRPLQAEKPSTRDPRLPPVGSVLKRSFGGTEHCVTVLEDAFEFNGASYRSLSAIARKIAGTSWNGYAFFALTGKEPL